MNRYIVTYKCIAVTFLGIIAGGLACGAGPGIMPPTDRTGSGERPTVEFTWIAVDSGFDQIRADAVAGVVGFHSWPQSETRRVAPRIDKSLLLHPDLVTREGRYHSLVSFRQTMWAEQESSWDNLVKRERPSANKSARKEYLLEGELVVRLCLAPSSRAAQEHLLRAMTTNSLPTESLVGMYASAKRPAGLGDVSFLTESRDHNDIRIGFLRDNVGVMIVARGCFVAEALPLARKIDTAITRQPALTYKELLARRPVVTIAPEVDNVVMAGEVQTVVSYSVTPPDGRQLLSLEASLGDQMIAAESGRIDLTGRTGTFSITLTAITNELLVGTFERELVGDKDR